jgi:hypothetical protein
MLALILGYAAYHRITKPEVPFSEVERQAVVTEAARILSERYIWGSDDTSLEGLKKEVEELKNLSRDRALASLLEIQALTPKFKEMLDRSLILAPVSSDTRTIFDYEHKIVKVYRGDSTKEMAMKLAESFAFLFQIEKLRGSELIFVEKNGTTYDTACGTIAECMKRWEQDSPRK